MDASTYSRTCTTLDHIYPKPRFGQPCYCGARVWGGKVKLTEVGRKEPSETSAQKVVDNISPLGVDLNHDSELKPITALVKGKMMQLTLKGLNKKNTQAIYSGARTSVRFPLAAFEGKTAPQTVEVNGLLGPAEKTPKAQMTPEERKAARAAKPKLTLAEKVARAEEKLARDKAKLEAQAAQPQL